MHNSNWSGEDVAIVAQIEARVVALERLIAHHSTFLPAEAAAVPEPEPEPAPEPIPAATAAGIPDIDALVARAIEHALGRLAAANEVV